MEFQFDKEWTLHPIGGDTGQAFMGTHNQERIFLKRNSSPFLAALSMEGITPRLIWTKRTASGDVYSAQEWLYGHTLSAQEIQQGIVTKLMSRYHHSDNLYNMLVKIGGKTYKPEDFLHEFENNLSVDLDSLTYINSVKDYLYDTLSFVQNARRTVCHSDLNRRNFILSEDHRLYLVDWEKVCIADPIFDITQLLVQYIPLEDWDHWFDLYNLHVSEETYLRIEWYSLMNLLFLIKADYQKKRIYHINESILLLRHIYESRYFKSSNQENPITSWSID
ncbi:MULTISPECIES: phosphotransferase family protein [Aerococcus]|uniref:phosphotransferase family protein n=1 Tax=Aerococcus TaxID=1375 RepID=UPI000DCD8235|nr:MULTISPECIES: phosphotransferase family protein [Aerococcus]KAA9297116.1 phosphotransferase family protein [Aerococcus tenax]MDK6688891.1 phosphotransferase family protein [Aerococcus urinae]MDK8133558.1 phosphotransferase family protein [Aerococcus urinae]MDK8485240.1 phosphotransferase family protein [Aerococcus urinae]MDL5179035.1 phosphotransferase family protein [Aerococcus tenax]